MIIKNQDQDLYASTENSVIYWDEKRGEDCKLLGYNFYAEVNRRPHLLATYDTENECEEVCKEIDKAIKAEERLFIMP